MPLLLDQVLGECDSAHAASMRPELKAEIIRYTRVSCTLRCRPSRAPIADVSRMSSAMKTLMRWTRWLALACVLAGSAHSHRLRSLRAAGTTAKATFAGGCFWCMEPPYDKLPGVISTTSGYMGGKTKNPTYEQVIDRHDRARRSRAGRIRPGEGELREAAGSVLAQHRPDAARRPVLRSRLAVPQRDLLSRRRAAEARRSVEGGAREEQAVQGRHRHRDHRRAASSTAPRNITRISTRRIRRATSSTAAGCGRDARLQALWGSSG